MGITVHAIVEVGQDREDRSIYWWELATIQFNKNWWLDILLYESADDMREFLVDKGWPKDADRAGDRKYLDQGLRWCSAEAFCELAEKAPDPDPLGKPWWRDKQVRGLAAFLKMLLEGDDPWRMRVLFYTM